MSRETTIRWLADQAVSQSDGALELEGVHGSFWSGIQIARVHFSSPDLEVTLDRLHLVWFWLPPNRIQVPVLSVDRAVVERKRVSADPTPVPDTLALPISIHIGRAAVAHLAVMSPGDSIVRIEGIEVDGQANARDLNFNVRVDDAMGVSVNATAAVAATAPFATAVEAKLHVRDAPMIDSVELDVRGPLARLAVTAQANFVDAASAPAVEDLIVLAPWVFNRFGHVAIVSQVGPDFIEVIQQNAGPFGATRERFALTRTNGVVRVENDRVLGWLRLPARPASAPAAAPAPGRGGLASPAS